MIWYILLGIISLYPITLILIYLIQEWFLFHPEKLPLYFKFKYPYPFEELTFDTEPGAIINGLIFRVPNSKGVVYYFHGNTRSIKGWAKFSRDFTGKGYDVMMIDYRGFGKSRGKRTEKGLHHDAQFGYDWLKERYGENHIIVYGRSMGSGFAARVASYNHPRMLILDAPYYSLVHLVQRYLPFIPVKKVTRFKIRTDKFLESINCPVYIYHGTRDFTVPYSMGKRLARLLEEKATLITIPGGGHNNLRDFPKYHEYMYYILDAIPTTELEPEKAYLPVAEEDVFDPIGSLAGLHLDVFSRPDGR
ncbi:MAG: alpha/beta fold hydrolase [Bacteroidetes bacterium]|nr:alpha/beta fold hydrolase [Bacteroidota bacterium]